MGAHKIDYTKLANAMVELEKTTRVANKLFASMGNSSGDIKFQQCVIELSTNLEYVEKLGPEVAYIRKWGKTFTGKEITKEAIDEYVIKVETANQALAADMKDVRSHHKK